MVQQVMKFLDDTPNLDVKLSVIETLRTVTEGKVRTDVLTITFALELTFPSPDLRRSRASPRYPHPFEYQEVTRRSRSCCRHSVRAAGGDLRVDDPT
jgi:hypothetical protein